MMHKLTGDWLFVSFSMISFQTGGLVEAIQFLAHPGYYRLIPVDFNGDIFKIETIIERCKTSMILRIYAKPCSPMYIVRK